MAPQERARVATELGIDEQWLYQCLTGRQGRSLPDKHCPAVEKATKGQWTCEELRPDLKWRRVRDKDWPWHKRGRPLLDLTVEA